MDILSTREVAEILGVSEATVKRWADAGTLRCFKTPGGHRKFRLRDVRAFLADQQDGKAPPSGPALELSSEQQEARAFALESDVDGLVSLVASLRLQGKTLAQAFDQVVAPAMADIGEGWARGRLTAAQEHIASNTVVDMLARVRPLVERGARHEQGRALCACLGGEQHDIGIRMVGLILAAEGFRPAVLGAGVPVGDLALLVTGDPPALLALSASASTSEGTLREDLALVTAAATPAGVGIIVGGAGFRRLSALPPNVQRFDNLEALAGAAARASPRGEAGRSGLPARALPSSAPPGIRSYRSVVPSSARSSAPPNTARRDLSSAPLTGASSAPPTGASSAPPTGASSAPPTGASSLPPEGRDGASEPPVPTPGHGLGMGHEHPSSRPGSSGPGDL